MLSKVKMRNKIGFLITENGSKWDYGNGLGKLFKERYGKNCSNENINFVVILSFKDELPKDEELEEYLGFVISGSHFCVSDDLPWLRRLEEFIRKIYRLNRPDKPKIFGTCFGHQLIANALGGKIENSSHGKFTFGSEEINIDEKLSNKKYVRKVLGDGRTAFRIMQCHGEEVALAPADAVCVGSSDICKNEILMYRDCILSTQGHPELTEDVMTSLILPAIARQKLLTESELEVSRETMKLADTDLLVQLVMAFITS